MSPLTPASTASEACTVPALSERTPLLAPNESSSDLSCCDVDGTSLDGAEHTYLSTRTSSYMSFTPRGLNLDRPIDFSQNSRGASLVLENCGTVARDHLASERTFLAYLRTSLTIASAGVALAQLLSISDRVENPHSVRLRHWARPLAGCMIVLALYVLGVGVSRYFSIQRGLVNGQFSATRLHAGVIALVSGAVITVLFGLLIERPTSFR
ncbi:hypothetical protein DFH08DRAFT_122154 [Mycena albidolilacea]|uniref:DUF202 domain-containing protein n=1 Tax=Mycena albidolilacea TaxID=1033008 RepID=A0AAD6YXP1_9AGAR|nr:hypothetical protein DFH08DRAFT_122154 [Mycena albidolilacea]